MNEGAYRPFFILYQGYRWMALCVLMGRCMARASSVLKSTAQSYDFIFISARDFGEKLQKKGLYATMNEGAYRPFFVSGILKNGAIRPEGAKLASGRMAASTARPGIRR